MKYYELCYMWEDDSSFWHIEGGWIIKTDKTFDEMCEYANMLTQELYPDSTTYFYVNPIEIIEKVPTVEEILELIEYL